jgi:hypothetical protein
MAETSAVEAAVAHSTVMLLSVQMCATQLHGTLHAVLGGLGVLRKPGMLECAELTHETNAHGKQFKLLQRTTKNTPLLTGTHS